MTETLAEKIIKVLDGEGIEYKCYKHEPVRTSEEVAKVRKEPLKIGAKAILFFADKVPSLLVVPGDRRVDTKAFKSKFKIKDLRMASPEEVLSITSAEIGGVSPFGSLMGIKTYCDERVFENEFIAFNAGARDITIKMESEDYKKVENPIISSFSLTKSEDTQRVIKV